MTHVGLVFRQRGPPLVCASPTLEPLTTHSKSRDDKLLLVVTESSVKSAWVEKEVETAFEKERKQGRTVLFPIRLDNAVMEAEEAWAADIRRTRHIGDLRE